MQEDELFGDLLGRGSHRGVSYYTWESGGNVSTERLAEAAVQRRVLKPGHALALNGNVAYWVQQLEEAGIEDMIDAGLGHRRSLADVEDYQLLQPARVRYNRSDEDLSFLSRDREGRGRLLRSLP